MSAAITFPLARYRLEWQASTPIRLPDYAGSMLRGAFGHALRKLACMTRQKDCAGCPLLSSCPYPAIFASPPPPSHTLQKFSQIPVPYIIEPPDWGSRQVGEGDAFAFHIVLVGRALRELPLIILAWRRAFSRGVGTGKGTAELVRIVHCGETRETEIHRPDSGTLAPHTQEIALDAAETQGERQDRLCLRFVTPLRLQQNGRALAPEKLAARTLLMALVRRANLLAEFHADGPLVNNFPSLLAASANIQDKKQLVWRDWTRFSSRQDQRMTLGGVIGQWTITGVLTPFLPFLRLGEWLHVGKEAAFGLGRYTLSTPGNADILPNFAEFRDCAEQHIGDKQKLA